MFSKQDSVIRKVINRFAFFKIFFYEINTPQLHLRQHVLPLRQNIQGVQNSFYFNFVWDIEMKIESAMQISKISIYKSNYFNL